ncbi:MAG: UDP-N-acetylmuramoyl-tripeptide--D-alanyl-D-alanine ligase [Actinomycetota bacterium]
MIRLGEIAAACGGTVLGEDRAVSPEAFVDSRAVVADGLFCAFRGEHSDGHDHVVAALAGGAGAALVDHPVEGAGPLVVVEDVRAAMGRFAAAHIAGLRDSLTVVAVTGSVGKTTTKDLLAAVLPGPVVVTRGSFNNEIGLPLTALRATPGTRYLVLEMGADRAGDITYLTSLVPPDVSVVLAVARAHLGIFGGIERVAEAKREIVGGLKPGGTAVLNADDHRVAAMSAVAPGPVVRFGLEPRPVDDPVTVGASDLRLDETGHASFTLRAEGGTAHVTLGLVGAHHVTNALAAASVAHSLGVPLPDVAQALSRQAAASPHRMSVTTRADGITIIDDAYNANPDSMAAALRTLSAIARGRRSVAVVGAMLELGDAEEEEHAAVGRLASELGIDRLVTVGPMAARAADEFPPERVRRCADVDDARVALRQELRPDDVVLIKASNGSRLWKLADEWTGGT